MRPRCVCSGNYDHTQVSTNKIPMIETHMEKDEIPMQKVDLQR